MKITKHSLYMFHKITGFKNWLRRCTEPRRMYKRKINVHYGPYKRQVFDLYYTNKEKKNILLIDIHGGFYVGSSRCDNFNFARFFLKKGIDVILLEYRLNNRKIETIDELHDVNNCISYIYNHLEELGLKDHKIFITGDSAGGHFTLLNAINLFCETPLEKNDYKINGILVNCPAYNYQDYGTYPELTDQVKKWVLGKYYQYPKYLKLLSARTYIEHLNLPIFVSTSKNDFLRKDSIDLIDDLKKYNKVYEFIDVNSNNIFIGHVHNVVYPRLKASMKVNKAMYNFMIKYAKD